MGAGKVNDDAGLLLHKRKNSSAQWLYRYTLTNAVVKWAWGHCEMSL
nr:DUF4102 domain-containing protein [Bartonella sp. MM73XJBT]